jgi:uncharacterized membrane protein (UPF0127 family)
LIRVFGQRAVAVAIGVSPGFVGCDRSEGTHAAVAGAPATRPTSTSLGASGSPSGAGAASGGLAATTQSPPCLVETPSEAPAAAEPASICPTEPEPPPALERAQVSFPAAPGAPKVAVEVARKPTEHARGLMYRTSMPADQGMLFSWPDERIRSFWMHNTCIPLDMLFLSRDQTVVGIQEQVPVLNDRPRSIPCPAAYVLEVNAGWTRQHGVRAGMRAVIEQ